jgi:nucleoside-diphosphate-sugar epimerase
LKIAELLNDMLDGKIDIDSISIDSDTASIAMDASLAKIMLGWQATIGVREGLQNIIGKLSN